MAKNDRRRRARRKVYNRTGRHSPDNNNRTSVTSPRICSGGNYVGTTGTIKKYFSIIKTNEIPARVTRPTITRRVSVSVKRAKLFYRYRFTRILRETTTESRYETVALLSNVRIRVSEHENCRRRPDARNRK